MTDYPNHTSDRDREIDGILLNISAQIQISKSQYNLAEREYHKVGRFLAGLHNPLAEYTPMVYPQGSFRIGTTNRPRGQKEFDLDIVCEFKSLSESLATPDSLLHEFFRCISSNGHYAEIAELKKRCVRLNYSGDFHLDILPAIPDPHKGEPCIKIPDHELHRWTDSNPKGFARWFEDRATANLLYRMAAEPIPDHESVAQKESLKLIVQLMKRARDVVFAGNTFNSDLAPASIILTTLAAEYYQAEGSVNQAMSRILNRILFQIKSHHSQMLIVPNPTNPDEIFSERWQENPESYNQFINWIDFFTNTWKRLQNLTGLDKIKREIEMLFGENVTLSAFSNVGDSFAHARQQNRLGVLAGTGLVDNHMAASVLPVKSNIFYGS